VTTHFHLQRIDPDVATAPTTINATMWRAAPSWTSAGVSLWSGQFRSDELDEPSGREAFFLVLGHMAAAEWHVESARSEPVGPIYAALVRKERWTRELELVVCRSDHTS
jgi:hypothetical protein